MMPSSLNVPWSVAGTARPPARASNRPRRCSSRRPGRPRVHRSSLLKFADRSGSGAAVRILSVESPSGARNEFQRCGSRFRGKDGVDDAGGVTAVFGAVGGVDLVVDVVRFEEENVLLDATGMDACFVPVLGA